MARHQRECQGSICNDRRFESECLEYPDGAFTKVLQLSEDMTAGETAVLTGRQGEWVSIAKNGIDGWVHTDYITEIQQTEKEQSSSLNEPEAKVIDQFTVSVDGLNVRKSPVLTSEIVGLIRKGESYSVEDIDGNWIRLSLDKKTSGWVYSFTAHSVQIASQPP